MIKRFVSEIHWPLFFATLGLVLIGTLFIYSAAQHDGGNYLSKHLMWIGVAFAVFMGAYFLGYRTFLSLSYIFYVAVIFLLLLVEVLGNKYFGAQRWLQLGPFVIQPSEFAKLVVVLVLANFLGSDYSFEKSSRTVFSALGLVLLPFLLVVKQPDLGTSLIFIPVVAVLLFFWGLRLRVFIFSAIAGLVAMPVFWHFLKAYQKNRILVFLDPYKDPLGSGYTALQSRIAIGSGGFLGKGYLHGTQTQLNFVPEHHTDFIFCVIGEEWGYMGVLIVLSLYAVLFYSAFQILLHTTDIKARLLVVGICAVIFSQVFINVGMTFGLMPITGLTLPLISYGGSSLLTTMASLGIILSIYRQRSIF